MRQIHILRKPLAMLAMGACGVLTSVAIAQAPVAGGESTWVQGRAIEQQPESRIEGDQAMDGAVAAAVIGAVAAEFGEREVRVRLDSVAVEPASMVDRRVTGQGRLDLGGNGVWMPFAFETSYNTRTERALSPTLELGGDPAVEMLALDSGIASALVAEVGERLQAEFVDQPVGLTATEVTAAGLGERYMKVEAMGAVDFDAEGRTRASIDALYDRTTGEWVRVRYELGATANWADETEAGPGAVAVR